MGTVIAKDSSDIPRFLYTDSSGRLYVLLTDGTTGVEVDSKTGAVKTITATHAEVHDSTTFSASHFFSNVADNGNSDLRITAGASKELHAVITVANQGNSEIYIYEGTTYDANGTAVTLYNKDRTSSATSDATSKHTPTVNTLGTNIYQVFAPGGSRQRAIGGTRTNAEEWIFKKSTDYLIRVTNRGGADMDISIEVEFYEID